jgi:hypothetical protein
MRAVSRRVLNGWCLTALPLGLLACQDVVDWLVPGGQPQDGKSRPLQVERDPSAGSGALGSPALLHVRARGGTHLAVRVEGGVGWELDQEPDQGRSEICVLLPEAGEDGWSRAQVLVASSRPVYDAFFGLARFDLPAVENAAGAAGVLAGGAGGEAPEPEPVPPSRGLLANVCPGAAIIDQETVHIQVPEVPSPEPGDGGNGGGGSGGDATAGGVPPDAGGAGLGGVSAGGAATPGAGGAIEPSLAGGGAGGAP